MMLIILSLKYWILSWMIAVNTLSYFFLLICIKVLFILISWMGEIFRNYSGARIFLFLFSTDQKKAIGNIDEKLEKINIVAGWFVFAMYNLKLETNLAQILKALKQ